MLYTTYLANAKKVTVDAKKYLIVRILPKGYKNNNDLIHVPALAPSEKLLFQYKRNFDWSFYVKQFKFEMEHRPDLKEAIENLYKELEKDQNICLICYEKDYRRCHRFLIAQKLMQKGIQWREL